jgi:hypothetical protein
MLILFLNMNSWGIQGSGGFANLCLDFDLIKKRKGKQNSFFFGLV